jgi:hypothetical protein
LPFTFNLHRYALAATQLTHTHATIAAIASSIGVPVMQNNSSQPSYPAPIYSKDSRVPSAPRWNPTPAQLSRLEELFSTVGAGGLYKSNPIQL